MRNLRKWALVLSLAAAVTVGAANHSPIPDVSEREASPSYDVLTLVVDFFVLYSRFSIPPG